MNMRALETHYRGYRFRSRLEARWAVFMDAAGVRWEYEPEGYDLGGMRYLPDFWLPENRTFLEVKPARGARVDEKPLAAVRAGGEIVGFSFVAFSSDDLRSDVWFAGELGTVVAVVPTVEQAWDAFLEWNEYYRCYIGLVL